MNETEMLSIFYQNRAASYEKLQMFDNVIQDCNKAIELNKRYDLFSGTLHTYFVPELATYIHAIA